MVALTEELLTEVTQRLVGKLAPERIYLFGSCAYGEPDSESDLDVMLVFAEEVEDRHAVSRAARKALRSLVVPVDVLVRSAAEFEDRAAWPSTIEATVRRKGRKLYG